MLCRRPLYRTRRRISVSVCMCIINSSKRQVVLYSHYSLIGCYRRTVATEMRKANTWRSENLHVHKFSSFEQKNCAPPLSLYQSSHAQSNTNNAFPQNNVSDSCGCRPCSVSFRLAVLRTQWCPVNGTFRQPFPCTFRQPFPCTKRQPFHLSLRSTFSCYCESFYLWKMHHSAQHDSSWIGTNQVGILYQRIANQYYTTSKKNSNKSHQLLTL